MTPQPRFDARTATQGYAQIPNSIIENMAELTPAELMLVLIVLRRGANTVSDEHWSAWTGKDARTKQNAIRGLRERGLKVDGFGRAAKFSFHRRDWDNWVRHKPRQSKAKVARPQRQPAKPEMHPDCQERGCQMACRSSAELIEFPKSPPAETPPEKNPVAIPAASDQQKPAKRVSSVTAANVRAQKDYTDLIGVFMTCGVALNEADLGKCDRYWLELSPQERTIALAYALARLPEWQGKDPQYVARPWNYLREKHWTRRGPQSEKKGFEKWKQGGSIWDAI